MKKKIWILNHHANDMYFDEGGRHYSIAKYLKRAGYEPTIFCSNAEHGSGKKYFDGVDIAQEHVAEKIGVPFVFIKGRGYTDNGIRRILCMIDYYVNVRRYAKTYVKNNGKPDVIIGSSVHPLACVAGIKLARKLKVPCIVEIRDLWPESIVAYNVASSENLLIKALYRLEKWIYTKADHIVMTWPGGYDYICEKGWQQDIPKKKVTHISNGVDEETYFLQQNKKIQDIDLEDDNTFKFIYTGSVRMVNNIGMIVDAARILKEKKISGLKILIYGDGDEKETWEKKATEEKLDNIVFKGKVDRTEIPAILKYSDVTLLHNTSTELDRFGQSQNKFFEYLAAGKPILMTYSVRHNVIKKEDCGMEITAQTPENIAYAMLYFYGMDSKKYKELSFNASRIAKNYAYSELTEKLIRIIESIE